MLSAIFPPHDFLLLVHNDHRGYYMPLPEWIADSAREGWISEGDKQQAVIADEAWDMKWRPGESGQNRRLLASSLDGLVGKDAQILLDLLPSHKCSLDLEHNPHRARQEAVTEWMDALGGGANVTGDGPFYDWPDDAEKQKAIATGEVWTLQWYPETPIGFATATAASLPRLLEYANKQDYFTTAVGPSAPKTS